MPTPLKVLFLAYSGEEGASARYRVYQFLPHLRRAGMEVEVRPFYESEFYKLIVEGRSVLQQLRYMFPAYLQRVRDSFRAGAFDVVFFHREAVPIGPVYLEWLARRLGAGTILDLDDAVFMNNPYGKGWLRTKLRNAGRTDRIMADVDCVCAANDYIADYARNHNGCVEMIPGAEDMARYDVAPLRPFPDRFVLGWTGSPTTEAYLNMLAPSLTWLSEYIPNLSLIVIGGGEFQCPGVDVIHVPWSLNDEIAHVRGFDVGVMPLPDDEWSKGKCGGKARVYMAAGVPPVASAIGYNRSLIDHGRTGLLVEPREDWFEPILKLYQDAELRRRMGMAAREHVAQHLSVEALAPRLIELIRKVATVAEPRHV